MTRIEWSTSTSTVGPKYGVPAAACAKVGFAHQRPRALGDRLGHLIADRVGGAGA